MKKWFIVLLCPLALSATAQNATDSLLERLSAASDTEKVQTLLALSRQYSYSDLPRSIRGEGVFPPAETLHDARGCIEASTALSDNYLRNGSRQDVLAIQMQPLGLYQKTHNLYGQANSLLILGATSRQLGIYPRALDFCLKSLKLAEKLKGGDRIAIAKWNVAGVNSARGHDSATLENYPEGLRLLKRQHQGHYDDMATITTPVGYFVKNRNQCSQALECFDKAWENAKKIPRRRSSHAISMILTDIGSLYETRRHYARALACNKETFELAQTAGDQVLLGLSYPNKGRTDEAMRSFALSNDAYLKAAAISLSLGMSDRAAQRQNAMAGNYLKLKNSTQAALYATKALRAANSPHLPETAEKALHKLATLYEQSGSYARSLTYLGRYQAIKDTLFNREKRGQMSKLQILSEADEKQKQIQVLKAETAREKILRNALVAGTVLIVFIGLLLLGMKRHKDNMIRQSQEALMQEQLKNVLLHESALQHEIDSKTKELATYALNFIQKNQLLEELNTRVTKIRKETDGVLAGELSSLQHLIRRSVNLDKDWAEFRLYFEQLHDRFFEELSSRYPGLSNKELRLCALLKLNLQTKEMATILGISPSSVKMARYRLRKKLHLNSEEDLTCFMINFEKHVSEAPR